VTREHFALAEQICSMPGIGIRAGDALHAAVALASNATLVTRDRALLAAAGAFGLTCLGVGV
jgi:predicted nucleic acid-binding protein